MATTPKAQAPAATQESTPPADTKTNVHLKLCDGNLSLTVMTKLSGDGKTGTFAVLQRSYKDKSGEFQNSQFLHVEDFLRGAELLRRAYLQLRQSVPVQPGN